MIPDLDSETLRLAGDSRSALGTGGMRSKLESARLVTRAGGSVIIASGKANAPLTRILNGEPMGTLFLARSGQTQGARKRWIGLTARPRGHLVVDSGAKKALEAGTRSLLAIGVVAVGGEFDKGDVVAIRDVQGMEFARGLTNYTSMDARQIVGMRTDQSRQVLGNLVYEEVIHKDNLVLTRG